MATNMEDLEIIQRGGVPNSETPIAEIVQWLERLAEEIRLCHPLSCCYVKEAANRLRKQGEPRGH